MKYKYNGGDCSQSFTIQEAEKFSCTDFDWAEGESGPPLDEPAYIVLVAQKDETEEYFRGTVSPGEIFTAIAGEGTDQDKFEADSTMYIYDNENDLNLMQLVLFHTSCSQNLFLKDRYGSAQVVEFTNPTGTFTCFLDATLDIVLVSDGQGAATINELSGSFTNSSGTVTYDWTPSPPVLPPGNPIEVNQQIKLDMTVEQEYEATVFLSVETGPGPFGRQCDASNSTSWVAGNPSPAGLGR